MVAVLVVAIAVVVLLPAGNVGATDIVDIVEGGPSITAGAHLGMLLEVAEIGNGTALDGVVVEVGANRGAKAALVGKRRGGRTVVARVEATLAGIAGDYARALLDSRATDGNGTLFGSDITNTSMDLAAVLAVADSIDTIELAFRDLEGRRRNDSHEGHEGREAHCDFVIVSKR